MIVTRIAPASAARMVAIVSAVLGLILGVVTGLLSLVGGVAFGSRFGIGAIVALPLLYALVGGITAWLAAVIYNVVARVAGGGGVEIELHHGRSVE